MKTHVLYFFFLLNISLPALAKNVPSNTNTGRVQGGALYLDLDSNNSGGISGTTFSTQYTEHGASSVIADNDVVIVSPNDSLQYIMIWISYPHPEDTLDFPILPSGIQLFNTSFPNALSFTMSGKAPVSVYKQLLKMVKMRSAGDYSNRYTTVTTRINDGNSSVTAYTFMNITAVNYAPAINNSLYNTVYTENSPGIRIVDTNLTISDDNWNMSRMLVSISNNFSQQNKLEIEGALPAGINASFTLTSVTLKGLAPKASYETAVKQIRYRNISDKPDTATIQIHIIVSDSSSISNAGISKIRIIAVNDTPQVMNEHINLLVNAAYTSSIKNLLANDTDAENDALSVSGILQNCMHGTLSFNDTTFTYLPNQNYTGSDMTIVNVCDSHNACRNDTIFATISLTTDIEDLDKGTSISIYPNPVVSTITITNTEINTMTDVYDLTGQLVFSSPIIANSIDVHHLKTGIYFLKIQGLSTPYKFVKE